MVSFEQSDYSDRIIVALDCGIDEALRATERLAGRARWVKVGMTMFYREGPSCIRRFKESGFKVFVDLKLHDIPHQVRGAAASLAECGADMMTLHASGGSAMMAAAAEGAREAAHRAGREAPVILGVTVLTSMDDGTLHAIGVPSSAACQVERLGGLVREAGLDGAVCSPHEASLMRGLLGAQAAVVTPGIRPLWAAVQDQKRITCPREAFERGASHIVIGRPIMQAPDPCEAFDRVCAELVG